MAARTILILRHGEKPETDADGPGLKPDGTPDPRGLTVRGWQRAGAWAALFGTGLLPDYPVPAAVYGASPHRSVEPKRPSRRPRDTVLPLAERLGLPLQAQHGQGDEAALAAELLAGPAVALVCWEHKRITRALLPALLGDARPAGMPTDWDPARFDVVLRLDWPENGGPLRLRQLLPCLLAGDSRSPMP